LPILSWSEVRTEKRHTVHRKGRIFRPSSKGGILWTHCVKKKKIDLKRGKAGGAVSVITPFIMNVGGQKGDCYPRSRDR